ncbi:ATP-binding cassette domain-containing protein [Imperialibacter roseus]|uniref:ATP-binding cassette domain-containing protein n=1 Tax=Imperialibacter roseus TaxID=1324217 RepID=A0ABZ0IJX8_9BACT|nr:ATP-binding cassette domain-containing protein [Imperialibacter roseus]WOK04469.1 ATP-binding cassette domain-containing protein [Imperialibacter roseus]
MMIVETNNLTKRYGRAAVVDQVSLQIPQGKIYGFLGLNGAGKTTTMRMLLGMINPTEGSVSLFGQKVPGNASVWDKVGYMIESTCAYPDLSVVENLNIFYRYHGLKDKDVIDKVIARLKLDQYRDIQASHLSLGNLQRLGLARALMHSPELLILDEPVNGLDPAGIVEIRHLLRELSALGTTVLISSHLLSEIAKVADTIGIIHHGALIKELEANQLHEEIDRKLILNSHDNVRVADLLHKNGIPFRTNAASEIEIMDCQWMSEPERIAEMVVAGHAGLTKLFTFEEDLESYFLRTIQQ